MEWTPAPQLYPPYLRARIRRGRGVGSGKSYVPWLRVRDVPSRGTSSVLLGVVIPRSFHFLSELETTYFFLVERRPDTVDVQEQWPILDIEGTLTLASQLGVRHPKRRGYPEPFTIDLLITSRIDGQLRYRAASIKTKEDAQNPAVKQRLAVEYLWCKSKGIPWTLVDTSSFTKVTLDNLRFARSWFRQRFEPEPACVHDFARVFLQSYRTNVPLLDLIGNAAKALRLPEATAQDLFRYCAWTDEIPITLSQPLALNRPLVLRKVHGRP